jgi:hypothetical protein
MRPERFFVSKRFLWPNWQADDIRTEQWTEGYHWYAYVGDVQVKEGDTVKWASEEEARAAAFRYIGIDTIIIA